MTRPEADAAEESSSRLGRLRVYHAALGGSRLSSPHLGWGSVTAALSSLRVNTPGRRPVAERPRCGMFGRIRARMLGARCFGVLEGGYNHGILGECVHAFLHGFDEGWTHGVSGRANRGAPRHEGGP
ncbi:MAG: hypothetical protein HZB55_07870 [Deltaproteobacteria bacterium]|nr:hypothetical protein [Deltaproteobacteria bacterium]